MQTEAFSISCDDGHTIRGTRWSPTGSVTGVIQLVHGLGEHHGRYQRFAEKAVASGFAVVTHDHRGHGAHAELPGHIPAGDGWSLLVNDTLRVNEWIRERQPVSPIVLLGHSMGSFVAQAFAMLHDGYLSALILSGSTWPQRWKLVAAIVLAHIESWRTGTRGHSALLDKLGFSSFNKRFKPARTELDWLSRDETEVDAYVNDPLCGGPYSSGLWLALLHGMFRLASDNELLRIRGDLPILITGGSKDPVGGDRGMSQLALHYAQTSHGRLTVKIYPEGRHEMLNEINRDEVTANILAWVGSRLPGTKRR